MTFPPEIYTLPIFSPEIVSDAEHKRIIIFVLSQFSSICVLYKYHIDRVVSYNIFFWAILDHIIQMSQNNALLHE